MANRPIKTINRMKKSIDTSSKQFLAVICLLTAGLFSCSAPDTSADIQLQFPSEHYDEALDGRLIVLISEHTETEPRFQLRDDSQTCQGFGMDVNDWTPGESLQFDSEAFGYPVRNF